MLKLIVADLDRTLLNDEKNISPYTLSILEKCKEKGIKVAFATARGELAAKRFTDLVKPDFLILNSGALVLGSKGEFIDQKFLSAETTDGIIKECCNNKNVIHITVETESGYFVSYREPNHPDYAHGIYYDFHTPLSRRAYKLTIEISDRKDAMEIGNKFSECKVTGFPEENWYRFARSEADKMNGVSMIAGLENIPLGEIAAFGDDYNDVEMIRRCGFGIAMENGIREAKEAARYICGNNNEDGVSRWLEKNVL